MGTEHLEFSECFSNDDNTSYSIEELLDQLMKDDSWEQNPISRMKTVIALKIMFENAQKEL